MFTLSQNRKQFKRRLILMSAILVYASSTYAIEEKPKKETLVDSDIEVIVVTSRHIKENAKEIPFSISVIGADDLKNKLMLNVEDALRNAPGVDVYTSGGAVDANIRIRGVGSLTQVNKDDGSVVVNIDGVSMPAGNISLGTLDIERIEILKGPQGTLFGRNSVAGAINITTYKPTHNFEAYGRVELGEGSQKLYETVLSGPFSDSLSGRLAVRSTSEDHWIENSTNGEPLTKPKSLAFRGSLLWEVSPKTSALFTAERQRQKGFLNLQLLQPFGDKPSAKHTQGVFDDNEKTIERFSAKINHKLENSQLTSITALVNTDFNYITGLDSKAAKAMFNFPIEYLIGATQDQKTLSQDLRLSSLSGDSIFWVVGLNLYDSKRSFNSRDLVSKATQNRDYDSNSQAVYGEVTFPLTASLKLTAGARYTNESKSYSGEYRRFNRDGSVNSAQDLKNLDENYTTGRLALSYSMSDSTNVYVMAARGNKSGGFNDNASQSADSTPYRPATVDNIEFGFKNESNNFKLNGAVFLNAVKDDHLLAFDFTTYSSSAVNADTKTVGAELEGSWAITDGFSLSGGVSFLDTEIRSDIPGVSGGPVAAGNKIPDVPRWSESLSANYYQPLPDFLGLQAPELNANVSVRHVNKRPADAQNHFDLHAYSKLDLRIALETDDIELYFWVDNLFDKQYELYGYINATFSPTAKMGAPSMGRRAGIGAIYRF